MWGRNVKGTKRRGDETQRGTKRGGDETERGRNGKGKKRRGNETARRRNNHKTYQLRSDNRNIYLPKPKTNFLKNSFPYRGAMSWNNLPNHIIDQALIEDSSVNVFSH